MTEETTAPWDHIDWESAKIDVEAGEDGDINATISFGLRCQFCNRTATTQFDHVLKVKSEVPGTDWEVGMYSTSACDVHAKEMLEKS